MSAAQAVLEYGKADYAWNLQIDPMALAGMEAMGKGKVVSRVLQPGGAHSLEPDQPRPLLGEDRSEYLDGANPHPLLTFTPIAQAMSMAVDRTLISERLYGSAGNQPAV